MKNSKDKIVSFIKSNKKIVLIVLAILFVVCIISVIGGKKGNGETVVLKKGDFIKTVSVTGKVVASENVDLGFETSGTISNIYKVAGEKVNKGDVIASLNSSELYAKRQKSEANLLEEQAKLEKLSASGGAQISTDKRTLVESIVKAYTYADDAVHNKSDQYFDKTDTSAPEIKYSFDDYFDRKKIINEKRMEIEGVLNSWKDLVVSLNDNNYDSSYLSKSKIYLSKVKDYIDTLSPAVFSFEVSSDLTQTMIDKYKSDLATARSNINDSSKDLITVEGSLSGSVSDARIQEASVRAVKADIASIDAQISKTIIRAPFSGIVSLQDGKVGQSVSASQKIASIISEGFEVEAYIPEVSIPGIQKGNKVTLILDSYPGESFNALLNHIDPAETVRDGVSNYKVKASIDGNEKIRSGMTGTIVIEIGKREDILSIGLQAIDFESDTYGNPIAYIFVKNGKKVEKIKVVLGDRDGKGDVEIVSGVSEGSVVYTDATVGASKY